jgi:hypothetical protein
VKHNERARRIALKSAALAGVLFLCLVGCPLPYQYSVAGYVNSSTTVDPSTPSISAGPVVTYRSSGGSGTLGSGQSANTSADTTITLSSDTVGAVIYYTVNGTTPDPRSRTTSKYSPSSPLSLALGSPTVDASSASLTVMATAIGPNMKPSPVTTATINLQYPQTLAPTFSLTDVVYQTDQSLELSCATSGATIYYTKISGNGAAVRPVRGQSGTVEYTGPIGLAGPSNTWTIAAIAVKSEMIDSPMASAVYTICYASPTVPTFSPGPSTFEENDTAVSITSDTGSTIWYTTNGTTPVVGGSSSFASGGTVTLSGGPGGAVTLSAISAKTGMNPSALARQTYNFKVARPVASVAAGAYNNVQSVTLTCATTSAVIYYTTDGTNPATNGSAYTAPILVNTSMTIRSFATRGNYLQSMESTDTYTLKVATPTFSAAGGDYDSAFSVTLANATSGASIHYTTDGTTPTLSSPLYTGTAIPVPNGETTTLQAIAARPGFLDSEVTPAVTYYVLQVGPGPTIGLATSSTIVVDVAAMGGGATYTYVLYRSTTPSFSPETQVTTSSTSINVIDVSLSPATTYYYRVVLVYPHVRGGEAVVDGTAIGATLDATNLPFPVSVTIPGSYATPSGYYPTFYVNATTFDTTSTANLALRQGGYLFVPYGDPNDNGFTIIVRTFDSTGAFVKDTAVSGTRYIWAVSVNSTTGVITYTGQSGGTASVSWPALMIQ